MAYPVVSPLAENVCGAEAEPTARELVPPDAEGGRDRRTKGGMVKLPAAAGATQVNAAPMLMPALFGFDDAPEITTKPDPLPPLHEIVSGFALVIALPATLAWLVQVTFTGKFKLVLNPPTFLPVVPTT